MCVLCGTSQFTELFKEIPEPGMHLSIARCNKCGLIATIPQPSARFLEELYGSSSYRQKTVSGDCCLNVGISGTDFNFVLTRLKAKANGNRLLDVGCGAGFFVQAALEAGWDAYGIEPSTYAAPMAKKMIGERIQQVFLSDVSFEDASFDALTLWGVLEHVPNPAETLLQSFRYLEPGGIIFIHVPNTKYIFIRRQLKRLITGQPGSVHAHEHLFHFTQQTLRLILQTAGFIDISEEIKSPYYRSGVLLDSMKRICFVDAKGLMFCTGINMGGILIFARKPIE